MAKPVGKGKAHEGKMDAIPTDSHLDARINRCVLINMVVPKLEQAEVREGNAKFVKQLETAEQMTVPKKGRHTTVGCSSTTSTTAVSIKSRTRNVPT